MKVDFKIQDADSGIWQLDGVRVSYPNLWEPGTYEGAKKPRLDTSFLIPIDQKEVIKKINSEMVKMAKQENAKISKLSQTKHPKFEKSNDGKHYVLKTSNDLRYPANYFDSKGKDCGNNPSTLIAMGADRELYAGCHARIKVTVNATVDNGKVKVWVNLAAIQFLAHNDRFGGSRMSDDDLSEGMGEVEVEDDFDDFATDNTGDLDDLSDDEDDFDLDDEFDLDD